MKPLAFLLTEITKVYLINPHTSPRAGFCEYSLLKSYTPMQYIIYLVYITQFGTTKLNITQADSLPTTIKEAQEVSNDPIQKLEIYTKGKLINSIDINTASKISIGEADTIFKEYTKLNTLQYV